jgi:hypothetical protein
MQTRRAQCASRLTCGVVRQSLRKRLLARAGLAACAADSLLDCAPVSTLEDVREVVREELGAYPEELWDEFSERPIASASLAQVCQRSFLVQAVRACCVASGLCMKEHPAQGTQKPDPQLEPQRGAAPVDQGLRLAGVACFAVDAVPMACALPHDVGGV